MSAAKLKNITMRYHEAIYLATKPDLGLSESKNRPSTEQTPLCQAQSSGQGTHVTLRNSLAASLAFLTKRMTGPNSSANFLAAASPGGSGCGLQLNSKHTSIYLPSAQLGKPSSELTVSTGGSMHLQLTMQRQRLQTKGQSTSSMCTSWTWKLTTLNRSEAQQSASNIEPCCDGYPSSLRDI